MITATQWIPRGFAAPFPKKYTLDEVEYNRIAKLAKLELDEAVEDLEEAKLQQINGDTLEQRAEPRSA